MNSNPHPVLAPNNDGTYKVTWEKGEVKPTEYAKLNVTLNKTPEERPMNIWQSISEKNPLFGTQITCQGCGACRNQPCESMEGDLPVTHKERRRMYLLIVAFEAAYATLAAAVLIPWGALLVMVDMGIEPDFDSLLLAVGALMYGAPAFIVVFLTAGSLLDWNDWRSSKVRRANGREAKCPYCKRWRRVIGMQGVMENGWTFDRHTRRPFFGAECKGSLACSLCFGTKQVVWEVPTRPNGELIETCRACLPPEPTPEPDSLLKCLNDLHATFQSLPKKEANTPDFALNLLDQQIIEARGHLEAGQLDKVANEIADVLGIAWQALAWMGLDPEKAFIKRTRTRVIPRALELAERDRAGHGYKPPKP